MIGKTVGPYTILEQLGSGGMGVVYKAHDDRLDRTVALKFLPPALSQDQRAKERFIQEARAASALDHANICTIHDVAQTDDGQVFIVMSFYDGDTLKYLMQDGPLPVDQTVDIATQVARGLARAHEAGIVHRDIKPANIMVTDRGEVKILDFGVAKFVTSADLTQEGSTIGTAAYMSPEQSRGESVDVRADQWSLGVLLYEMLSGKRPFAGGYDAAMVYAILNEEPAAVDSLRPDAPPKLAEVVSRCLSKDPEARFAATSGLVDALEEVRGGSTTHSASDAPARDAAPSASKTLGAFAVVAILALATLWSAMMRFGLPGWVFATGVVLMALGVPILAWSAILEKKRGDMDTGERRAQGGLAGWLTVRRATFGGIASMSALALVAVVFMGMRAAGIGPAATLITSGALDERGLVVFSDFENRTQDPNLGVTVTEAFRIDLSQSSAVTVLDAGGTREALERMERDPNAAIDIATAREIAQRTGAKAVVAGEISSVGAGFVLSARLLSAGDGTELVALRENAADDTRILDAIDKLSGRLRQRVGESLVTIRSERKLEDVTTGSLEALRLFTEADLAADEGRYGDATQLLEQTIAIDSTFGMAYRKLSVVLSNSGASPAERARFAQKAYDLRDSMSKREALLATAYYYNSVEFDRDRIVGAYEEVLETWPNDLAALNNLAIQYNALDRNQEAADLLRRALSIQEGVVFRSNLVDALAQLGQWDELEKELNAYIEKHPQVPLPRIALARLSFKQGDARSASAHLDTALTLEQLVPGQARFVLSTRHVFAQYQGKYAEAERLMNELTAGYAQQGAPSAAFREALFDNAMREWALGRDRQDAADVRRIAARFPMQEMYIGSRQDPLLVGALARAGDMEGALNALATYREEVPEDTRFPGADNLALGMIASAEDRVPDAVAHFDSARTAWSCLACLKELEGDAWARIDSVEQAIAAYEAFRSEGADEAGLGIFEEEAPVNYRLGALYERSDRLDDALAAYRRVTEIWADADPEYRAIANDAQSRIDRILELQAREPSAVPSTGP